MALLAEQNGRARPLAGGTDLLVQMRLNLHDIDLVRRYATRLVALRAGRKVWEGTAEEFDRQTSQHTFPVMPPKARSYGVCNCGSQ